MATSIGIIGFGSIGGFLYDEISAHPEWGLEVAFVCNKAGTPTERLASGLVITDAAKIDPTGVSLIVEAAHPDITRGHGERFLRAGTDYMPLSLTALADEGLLERLEEAAQSSGATLYIPHGAAVGIDSLAECRDVWDSVRVVMRKNPKNLDLSECPEWKGASIMSETVLYEGPTRGACSRFPRNVNAHAAVALAGIGFDRTVSVLVADPALDVSVIEIEARGAGVSLQVERRNPLKGVSGVFTLRSALSAVRKAAGKPDSLELC